MQHLLFLLSSLFFYFSFLFLSSLYFHSTLLFSYFLLPLTFFCLLFSLSCFSFFSFIFSSYSFFIFFFLLIFSFFPFPSPSSSPRSFLPFLHLNCSSPSSLSPLLSPSNLENIITPLFWPYFLHMCAVLHDLQLWSLKGCIKYNWLTMCLSILSFEIFCLHFSQGNLAWSSLKCCSISDRGTGSSQCSHSTMWRRQCISCMTKFALEMSLLLQLYKTSLSRIFL